MTLAVAAVSLTRGIQPRIRTADERLRAGHLEHAVRNEAV
jgi:hypothetical protein